MSGKLFKEFRGGCRGWALAAGLCLVVCAGGSQAQTGPFPSPAPATSAPSAPVVDGSIHQAGCAACEGGVLGLQAPEQSYGGGCASCGAGAGPGCGCGCGCYPGRQPCDCCCDDSTYFGRLFGGIYHCICCPDPCYEGHWCALADASFFQTSGPRPETQMRLKLEDAIDVPFPDKGEFFWARADGNGKGPMPKAKAAILAPNDVNYREFHMINEAAIGKFSASIDLPFREVHQADPYNLLPSNGFGDMVIGTKSMLLDCELLQFTFEFNTFIPTGNFLRGLGTGHVSLEPGFLWALKLAPEWYLQNEFALRIPIGGDSAYQGNVFHYHASLNHTLWNCGHGIVVVGTAELNGYDFINGQYTNTGAVATSISEGVGDVVNVGPGVRLVICDKIDFGIAGFFNLTGGSVADRMLQAEFRWRF